MAFLDGLREFVKVHLDINIQIGVKTVNIITDPRADVVSFDEVKTSMPEQKRDLEIMFFINSDRTLL